jgi:NADH-quinone oxidoreductase subunit H
MDELLRIVILPFLQILIIVLVVLGAVAYLTLLERKVIAWMQVRLGPMRVGPRGLLQPIADVIKLLLKEDIVPDKADRFIYWAAPVVVLVPALMGLAVIPFAGAGGSLEIFGVTLSPWIADVNIGLLYVLAISSVGVFGIVLGGWASNSKYPLLGGLRSAAQMISYEVPLALSVIGALMIVGSASLVSVVQWQAEHTWLFWLQPVGMVMFFIAGVAESNRHPFDLPEAENELVAGFHTEYSGMKFAFFFLAEYVSMIVLAALSTTLFLGGWLPVTFGLGYIVPALPDLLSGASWGGPVVQLALGVFWFFVKTFCMVFLYLWLRATFPRYRYDQLMAIGWKYMIPLALAWIMLTGLVILLVT